MPRKSVSEGPTGTNKVSFEAQYLVRYWRAEMGCSEDELREAVAALARSPGDDALRLTTATPDQLSAAAAFLAKARARFTEAVRDARKVTAIERLDAAGQPIGAEIRPDALVPLASDRD